MAVKNKIGNCTCPLCRGVAEVGLSEKSQLVYLVCNCCNIQLFARSGRSDDMVRQLLLPPKADPAPVADVKPSAPATPKPVQTEPEAPAVQPAPVKTRSPFAMFGADDD